MATEYPRSPCSETLLGAIGSVGWESAARSVTGEVQASRRLVCRTGGRSTCC
jgi:hypothetical protein